MEKRGGVESRDGVVSKGQPRGGVRTRGGVESIACTQGTGGPASPAGPLICLDLSRRRERICCRFGRSRSANPTP